MRETTKRNERCVFCGKIRTVEVVSDDGVDWLGHQRGSSYCDIYDNGCDCSLGQLEHEKQKVVPMCLNCKFYVKGCCTNEKELSQVSKVFDVGNQLRVKDDTRKCQNWEIDLTIFKRLLGE